MSRKICAGWQIDEKVLNNYPKSKAVTIAL